MGFRVRVEPRRLLRLDEVRGRDGLARIGDGVRESIDERPVERVAAMKPVLGVPGTPDPVHEAAYASAQAQFLAELLLLKVLGPVVVSRRVAVVVVETARKELVESADRRESESIETHVQR